MATATTNAAKQVKVLARYHFKATGHVVYMVVSSNGDTTYCTTIINGRATGCTCPARKPCYHMVQLQALEAQRAANAAPGAQTATSGQQQLEAWYTRCHVPQGPLSHERNQDRFLGVAAIIDHYGIDVATARRIARLRQHKATSPSNRENEREIVRDYFRLLQADTERAVAAADDPWVGLSADERRVAYAEYFMVNSY